MSEYATNELQKNATLAKQTKTFEEFVDKVPFLKACNYEKSPWLKRMYLALKFHNFDENNMLSRSLLLPEANKFSEFFESYYITDNRKNVKNGYFYLSTSTSCGEEFEDGFFNGQPFKMAYVKPTQKLLESIEDIIGPITPYQDGSYHWEGLKSFEIVKHDDGNYLLIANSGYCFRSWAGYITVMDKDTIKNKLDN